MKNLMICLVDDDKEDREIFKDAFDELGTENTLMTFNNGLELLEFLDNTEQLPDIIFLDLNMPVLSGLDTLKEIRKKDDYRSLSIAIYSTSSNEKDIEETLIAGANIYITKPAGFQSLKEAIAKIMKVNWQFQASELSRDTFVFVV